MKARAVIRCVKNCSTASTAFSAICSVKSTDRQERKESLNIWHETFYLFLKSLKHSWLIQFISIWQLHCLGVAVTLVRLIKENLTVNEGVRYHMHFYTQL